MPETYSEYASKSDQWFLDNAGNLPADWPLHRSGLYHLPPRQLRAIERARAALEGFEIRERAKETKVGGASRYTTQYAVEWGRSQGWKLEDRERYDYRTKRHHDLALGADALFMSESGLVFVQGAGRYERAKHLERFEERGGKVAAARYPARFAFVVFDRGTKAPIVVEWWA